MMSYVRSINVDDWNTPYAVTLRFRTMTCRPTASLAIRHFLTRLNRKVYKNANIRFGKELRRICVFEGGELPHSHMTLESPEHMSDLEFTSLVGSTWSSIRHGATFIKTSNGGRVPIFKMVPMYSSDWVDYCGKLRDKISSDDADIENWLLNAQHCRH